MKSAGIIAVILVFFAFLPVYSQSIIADHTCIDIYQIPVAAIESAKENLHIGYGYTSHGSQITSGMSCLVDFMNSKSYPYNLFQYNESGSGGALHLFSGDGYGEGPLDHDAGYYPNWVEETREFLGAPNAQGRGSNNPVYNVIMWAWCGQLSGYSTSDVYNLYLNDMNQLEQDYFGVTFVYMTGHSDGSGQEGDLHRNNQTIRTYCINNDKVLFDFYDIECYDPDGNYFGDKHVTDECYYDGGNWATEWQDAHIQGVDWFDCGIAHSQPINGNMKAYAIWWLWACLAGWGGTVEDPTPPSIPQNLQATVISETQVNLTWDASTDEESGISRYRVYRDDQALATTTSTAYSDNSCVPGQTYQYQVSALNGAVVESERSGIAEVSTPIDNQPPSVPTGLTASPLSSSQITLSWDAATDNTAVAGYRVFRNGAEIGTVSDIHFIDTGLTPATAYQYQVSAYDVAGNESGLSQPASATTLDPTQEKTTIRLENQDDVDDSFIYSDDPWSNYGSDCCPGQIDRSLIRFNLPAEVFGKQIISATLSFYVWNQSNYHDNTYLKIYSITRSWDEYGVTWMNATDGETWATPGGDADMSAPVAQIRHLPGEENWNHTFYPPVDITPLVQQWADLTRPNHGLLVVNDGQTEIGLKASEYSDGSRPYLLIEYTDKSSTKAPEAEPVTSFRLYSNFPNPFNAGTTIQFDVPERNNVEIKVFDLQGREIATLVSGQVDAGRHQVHFMADDLASGVYLYSLRVGQEKTFQKMILLK